MDFVKRNVFVITALLIIFVFSGCMTAAPPGAIILPPGFSENYYVFNSEGKIMYVIIPPMRDFTTLGLIFVESSATYDSNGNIIEGSKITLDMLMREAHKLKADDIINIKLDEIENISVTEEIRMIQTTVTDSSTGQSRVENRETKVHIINKTVQYKANAIAIKYTNNIVPPPVSSNQQDSTNSGLDIGRIISGSR